jgi:hypothetical protein
MEHTGSRGVLPRIMRLGAWCRIATAVAALIVVAIILRPDAPQRVSSRSW